MATVTCPRCAGFPNAFSRFQHVNEGLCLLCNGALVVRMVIAQDWNRANPTIARAARPSKMVTVGGFTVRIERAEDGEFELVTFSDNGELRSSFAVEKGQIARPLVCNGHLSMFAGASGFVASVQAALR